MANGEDGYEDGYDDYGQEELLNLSSIPLINRQQ